MAPQWTGAFGASYETVLDDMSKLSLSVDTKYSDDYLPSGFGNPFAPERLHDGGCHCQHADQVGLISLPRSVRLQLTWRY